MSPHGHANKKRNVVMAAQENVVIFSIIIIVPFLSFLYVHTWYGPNVFLFIFPISSIGSQSVSQSFIRHWEAEEEKTEDSLCHRAACPRTQAAIYWWKESLAFFLSFFHMEETRTKLRLDSVDILSREEMEISYQKQVFFFSRERKNGKCVGKATQPTSL